MYIRRTDMHFQTIYALLLIEKTNYANSNDEENQLCVKKLIFAICISKIIFRSWDYEFVDSKNLKKY